MAPTDPASSPGGGDQGTPTALGIDIGGSGIKGGLVDLVHGRMLGERVRLSTPRRPTPDAVAEVVAQVAAALDRPGGTAGVAFPGVVTAGTARTAVNLHRSWVGVDAAATFGARLGRPVTVINDADAAGVAEMRVGAGAGRFGTVVVVTLGTGIGTAVFVDGRLVPNTELGHIEIGGRDAETRAAASVRDEEGLSMSAYAKRVETYLRRLHALLWPELFILGGGISAKADELLPRLSVPCEVIPAALRNSAGIVGAALVAADAAHGSGHG